MRWFESCLKTGSFFSTFHGRNLSVGDTVITAGGCKTIKSISRERGGRFCASDHFLYFGDGTSTFHTSVKIQS